MTFAVISIIRIFVYSFYLERVSVFCQSMPFPKGGLQDLEYIKMDGDYSECDAAAERAADDEARDAFGGSADAAWLVRLLLESWGYSPV